MLPVTISLFSLKSPSTVRCAALCPRLCCLAVVHSRTPTDASSTIVPASVEILSFDGSLLDADERATGPTVATYFFSQGTSRVAWMGCRTFATISGDHAFLTIVDVASSTSSSSSRSGGGGGIVAAASTRLALVDAGGQQPHPWAIDLGASSQWAVTVPVAWFARTAALGVRTGAFEPADLATAAHSVPSSALASERLLDIVTDATNNGTWIELNATILSFAVTAAVAASSTEFTTRHPHNVPQTISLRFNVLIRAPLPSSEDITTVAAGRGGGAGVGLARRWSYDGAVLLTYDASRAVVKVWSVSATNTTCIAHTAVHPSTIGLFSTHVKSYFGCLEKAQDATATTAPNGDGTSSSFQVTILNIGAILRQKQVLQSQGHPSSSTSSSGDKGGGIRAAIRMTAAQQRMLAVRGGGASTTDDAAQQGGASWSDKRRRIDGSERSMARHRFAFPQHSSSSGGGSALALHDVGLVLDAADGRPAFALFEYGTVPCSKEAATRVVVCAHQSSGELVTSGEWAGGVRVALPRSRAPPNFAALVLTSAGVVACIGGPVSPLTLIRGEVGFGKAARAQHLCTLNQWDVSAVTDSIVLRAVADGGELLRSALFDFLASTWRVVTAASNTVMAEARDAPCRSAIRSCVHVALAAGNALHDHLTESEQSHAVVRVALVADLEVYLDFLGRLVSVVCSCQPTALDSSTLQRKAATTTSACGGGGLVPAPDEDTNPPLSHPVPQFPAALFHSGSWGDVHSAVIPVLLSVATLVRNAAQALRPTAFTGKHSLFPPPPTTKVPPKRSAAASPVPLVAAALPAAASLPPFDPLRAASAAASAALLQATSKAHAQSIVDALAAAVGPRYALAWVHRAVRRTPFHGLRLLLLHGSLTVKAPGELPTAGAGGVECLLRALFDALEGPAVDHSSRAQREASASETTRFCVDSPTTVQRSSAGFDSPFDRSERMRHYAADGLLVAALEWLPGAPCDARLGRFVTETLLCALRSRQTTIVAAVSATQLLARWLLHSGGGDDAVAGLVVGTLASCRDRMDVEGALWCADVAVRAMMAAPTLANALVQALVATAAAQQQGELHAVEATADDVVDAAFLGRAISYPAVAQALPPAVASRWSVATASPHRRERFAWLMQQLQMRQGQQQEGRVGAEDEALRRMMWAHIDHPSLGLGPPLPRSGLRDDFGSGLLALREAVVDNCVSWPLLSRLVGPAAAATMGSNEQPFPSPDVWWVTAPATVAAFQHRVLDLLKRSLTPQQLSALQDYTATRKLGGTASTATQFTSSLVDRPSLTLFAASVGVPVPLRAMPSRPPWRRLLCLGRFALTFDALRSIAPLDSKTSAAVTLCVVRALEGLLQAWMRRVETPSPVSVPPSFPWHQAACWLAVLSSVGTAKATRDQLSHLLVVRTAVCELCGRQRLEGAVAAKRGSNNNAGGGDIVNAMVGDLPSVASPFASAAVDLAKADGHVAASLYARHAVTGQPMWHSVMALLPLAELEEARGMHSRWLVQAGCWVTMLLASDPHHGDHHQDDTTLKGVITTMDVALYHAALAKPEPFGPRVVPVQMIVKIVAVAIQHRMRTLSPRGAKTLLEGLERYASGPSVSEAPIDDLIALLTTVLSSSLRIATEATSTTLSAASVSDAAMALRAMHAALTHLVVSPPRPGAVVRDLAAFIACVVCLLSPPVAEDGSPRDGGLEEDATADAGAVQVIAQFTSLPKLVGTALRAVLRVSGPVQTALAVRHFGLRFPKAAHRIFLGAPAVTAAAATIAENITLCGGAAPPTRDVLLSAKEMTEHLVVKLSSVSPSTVPSVSAATTVTTDAAATHHHQGADKAAPPSVEVLLRKAFDRITSPTGLFAVEDERRACLEHFQATAAHLADLPTAQAATLVLCAYALPEASFHVTVVEFLVSVRSHISGSDAAFVCRACSRCLEVSSIVASHAHLTHLARLLAAGVGMAFTGLSYHAKPPPLSSAQVRDLVATSADSFFCSWLHRSFELDAAAASELASVVTTDAHDGGAAAAAAGGQEVESVDALRFVARFQKMLRDRAAPKDAVLRLAVAHAFAARHPAILLTAMLHATLERNLESSQHDAQLDRLATSLAEGLLLAQYVPVLLASADATLSRHCKRFPSAMEEFRVAAAKAFFIPQEGSSDAVRGTTYATASEARHAVWQAIDAVSVAFQHIDALCNTLQSASHQQDERVSSQAMSRLMARLDAFQQSAPCPHADLAAPLYADATALTLLHGRLALHIGYEYELSVRLATDLNNLCEVAERFGLVASLGRMLFACPPHAAWFLPTVCDHLAPASVASSLCPTTGLGTTLLPSEVCPLRSCLFAFLKHASSQSHAEGVDEAVVARRYGQSGPALEDLRAAEAMLQHFVDQAASAKRSLLPSAKEADLKRQRAVLDEMQVEFEKAARHFIAVEHFDKCLVCLRRLRLIAVQRGHHAAELLVLDADEERLPQIVSALSEADEALTVVAGVGAVSLAVWAKVLFRAVVVSGKMKLAAAFKRNCVAVPGELLRRIGALVEAAAPPLTPQMRSYWSLLEDQLRST